MRGRALTIWLLAFGLAMAASSVTGCVKYERRVEKDGTRVKVRAPFTRVDVYAPAGDDDETDVDVDVDVDR